MVDVADLADDVRVGKRAAISRAVTLIESSRSDHRAEARELLEQHKQLIGQAKGEAADILPGNSLPLKAIPAGTMIHNIELRPGKGGQMVRSAGGSAQLVAGNRRTGRIALRTWAVLVVVGLGMLVASFFWHGVAFWAGTNTMVLQALRIALMALAVGWAYLFVDAWRLGQPLTLQRQHRLAIVGVNGFLCFSVVGSLLFASHVLGVQKDFMSAMFTDGAATGAHDGRYNVLLLGGDSGSDRWTSVRGRCAATAAAPGSYRVEVPALDYLVCRTAR